MAEWFQGIITAIYDALRQLVVFVVGLIEDAAQWTFDKFVDGAVRVANWVLDFLPAGWQDFLQTDWSPYTTYLGDVAWILPIQPLFVLLLATYTLTGAIRLVRWAKSFVPFIGA